MKILFIGDIVGKVGRQLVGACLPDLAARHNLDLVIANGENIAAGFGLTESLAKDLFRMGVQVITTGNHVWDKKEFVSFISKEDRIIRPANFAPGVPGYGSILYGMKDGVKVGVLNLAGRVFMPPADCPFRAAETEIAKLKQETEIIIVDFHAEATSEKVALGYYLDGKATAVLGTHTHVQTADEKILPGGTGYITDVGMTGPLNSIIGIDREQIIRKFLTGMPDRFETAQGEGILSAVVLDVENESGKTRAIERLQLKSA